MDGNSAPVFYGVHIDGERLEPDMSQRASILPATYRRDRTVSVTQSLNTFPASHFDSLSDIHNRNFASTSCSDWPTVSEEVRNSLGLLHHLWHNYFCHYSCVSLHKTLWIISRGEWLEMYSAVSIFKWCHGCVGQPAPSSFQSGWSKHLFP